MHYRHLKRIARGESRLNIDAKWLLSYDKERCVQLALLDTMQEVVFIPRKRYATWFLMCDYKHETPCIWLRKEYDGINFACRYDLIRLSQRLLNIEKDIISIRHVPVETILKCYGFHLIWKLEQNGIKGLITYKNRLNKRVLNKDTMFITLNEIISKYIVKTYGNKKRTTSQYKKSLRISDE
jgi:hypothetical protein